MRRTRRLRPTHGITLYDVKPTPTAPAPTVQQAPTVQKTEAVTPPPVLLDEQPRRSFWASRGYLFLCFLLPALLVFFLYLARGMHPIGDGSVLVLDLNGQYVWFFEALRNAVRGDASLIYSFARALGGEFLGIYAYYVASPLSYLVALFPTERMLEALLVLFMLKAGLCGWSFGYYMHKTLKQPKPFAVLIFSVCYAMSAYAIVYQHNTMWIDAMLWLPLITLGIESIIKRGKFKLYTVSLAIAVFSNFYIGYMLCIYCLIYFFLYYLAHGRRENNPLGERCHFLKSLLRMAFFSLLAVGIAAVILLSAYYALNFGKTTFTESSWEWTTNFNAMELFYKFLPGSYDTVRPEGYPLLYCGALTILLIPAYFLSHKRPLRQQIAGLILVLIFLASMIFSVTDLIWHGFQKPNWLNYRYSFMLCFYLCVLACRALSEFNKTSLRIVALTGGGVLLLCFFLKDYTDGAYVTPPIYSCILFSVVAVVAYLALMLALRKLKCKRLVSFLLCFVVTAEVFVAGLLGLHNLGKDVGFTGYSTYNNFLKSVRPIVEEVQDSDDSFYRMEKTVFSLVNDNMALNMNGLSGSTSTLNYETVMFLNKMGYASSSHWSKYLGGTPVNDSLLGIKYLVSKNLVYSQYYDVYKTDPANGLTAYYNPYALSLAYGVDDAILDFPLGYLASEAATDKEKESAITALKGKINEWLNIQETVNDAEYVDPYDSPFDRLNAIVTAMLGEEKTLEIFVPIRTKSIDWDDNTQFGFVQGHYSYSHVDPDQPATITYYIQMPADAELFFYEPTDYPREVNLQLRSGSKTFDMGPFNGHESQRIISLGWQQAGQKLYLDLTLADTHYYPMRNQKVFYYIDREVFEDAMARLATDQYEIEEFTETSFKGKFTASRADELVLTTLAYDEGWEIRVDGKKVEPIKALGALMAFRIDGDAGETHTVEMVYRPKTLVVGTTVSLVSLGTLALLVILERPLSHVPILRSLVAAQSPRKRKKKSDDADDGEDKTPPDGE